MSPLSLLLLLLTVVSTTSTIIEGMAIAMEVKTVPSFTVQELLSNQRSEEFAAILRTTGLLTIEMPLSLSFNDMYRHSALDGLCRCDKNQLLMVENSDTALLDDGTTIRTTVATATAGKTPRPLPATLSQHCGLDTVTSMEQLRDQVAGAAEAFVRALDRLILGEEGNSEYNNPATVALLHDSRGRSYDRVASILNAANHLEHFHVYSKKTAVVQSPTSSSLDWHTDAGLFLAFAPALDCRASATAIDDVNDVSFWYKDEHGKSTRAVFQPNSIAIMLGAGAEHWLHSPVPLKATRHAVAMNEGDERAWYGMSKCHNTVVRLSIFDLSRHHISPSFPFHSVHMVPESAIIQESPPKTFRDMKKSMTLSANRVYGQGDSTDSISIGCGSATAALAPNFSKLPHSIVPSRRRLQMVGSPSDCNNSTNFFCWMSCLDIPNVDRAEAYVTSGYSLYCLDPSALSTSGHDVAQAVAECPYGVHNPKCLGSWQFSVPGVPSTQVVFNATNPGKEPFCYGGTSMYMDGFHWLDTVCVIYLFPEWILNTEGKFVAAAIGSLFVGVLLEAVIMRRRMVMSSMGASYRRLAASAMFYGLQLTIGYFAMLVVMTYSGPLFMCIILGIVGGHVLFNAKDAVFAAKESPSKVVSHAAAGQLNTCCPHHPGQASTGNESSDSCCNMSDDDGGVPEGSTPCCQHTL